MFLDNILIIENGIIKEESITLLQQIKQYEDANNHLKTFKQYIEDKLSTNIIATPIFKGGTRTGMGIKSVPSLKDRQSQIRTRRAYDIRKTRIQKQDEERKRI